MSSRCMISAELVKIWGLDHILSAKDTYHLFLGGPEIWGAKIENIDPPINSI